MSPAADWLDGLTETAPGRFTSAPVGTPKREPAADPGPPQVHKEHLVVGPPGTGKTWYLSHQVQRLVDDPRYGPNSIAIGSLTRAAAEEIAGRTQLPRGAVGTLHAHCYRGLDRPAMAETPDGLRAWNGWLTQHGERQSWRIDPRETKDVEWTPPEASGGATEGSALLADLAVVRARMSPRDVWPQRILDFADRWERFKADQQVFDFTDLIERGIAELPAHPNYPRVFMLDEAQDMSRLEFTLARQWGGRCEQLVVVGDPWQNLYEWRGSDPAAFFAGETASQTVLARSRRVPAAVHRYSMGWLAAAPPDLPPFDYEPRFNDPTDETSGIAEGSVTRHGHVWAHPEGLVNLIEQDVADGKSVMVLATCSFMLDPLIRTLRDKGLPFHNPYRPTNGAWNPMRGTGRLLSFLRPDRATWGDDARPWTWDDVERWMDPMKAAGLLAKGAKTQVDYFANGDRIESGGFRKKGEADDGGGPVDQARMRRLFKDGDPGTLAMARALSCDVEWWASNLLESKRKQVQFGLKVYRKHGGAALVREPQITVGTIHSVKGGEADSVYVFPDLSRQAWEGGWLIPSQRGPVYRQFYVAFTRARSDLHICAPASGQYAVLPQVTS